MRVLPTSAITLVLALAFVTSGAEARPRQQGDQPQAAPFAQGATNTVCFTPGQDCQGLIVSEIGKAQKTVLVQAYSFTSAPIAKALVDAKKRGIVVQAILDKSQRGEKYTGATFLKNEGIPVVIDEKPAIAHNKVMVIDGSTVVTGSFNFTKSAQEKNAENVFIISGDRAVADLYTQNWQSRLAVSVPY